MDKKPNVKEKSSRRGNQLLVLVFTIIIVLASVLYIRNLDSKTPVDKTVATGKLKLSKTDNSTSTFTYSNTTVSSDMNTDCNIPASIKINATTCESTGNIEIYINGVEYAVGAIINTGNAVLSSGCGCSTVCVCEIKTGENTLSIISKGFEGEIVYEIFVKEG